MEMEITNESFDTVIFATELRKILVCYSGWKVFYIFLITCVLIFRRLKMWGTWFHKAGVVLILFVFSLASMNFFWRSGGHVQKVDQRKAGFLLVFFRGKKSLPNDKLLHTWAQDFLKLESVSWQSIRAPELLHLPSQAMKLCKLMWWNHLGTGINFIMLHLLGCPCSVWFFGISWRWKLLHN